MADQLRVTVWRVPTPLPRPVLTPLGPWDTFFHLVVVVEDREGYVGWGYSGLATAEVLDAAVGWTHRWLREASPGLAGLLAIEQVAASAWGTAGTAGNAASNAVSMAAWDLAGRRLGVACADLWGRRPGIDSVQAYASGFFLDCDDDALRAEAEGYRAQGFRLVKMRVGLDTEIDLRRLAVVHDVFPGAGSIAVDAVNAWDAGRTRAFAARSGVDLLWVEDPTPYDQLGALRGLPAPLAAGESLETTTALADLAAVAGLDYLLLDVQRLGGPARFLAAAHALAAQGWRIGGHIYTHASVHLLACVDDPGPVEVFDWSDILFVDPPAARPDGTVGVQGPGLGATVDMDALRRHGHAVA